MTEVSCGFDIGDRVVLLRLDNWFFDGMESATIDYLTTCIGRPTVIEDLDEYGHAELDFIVTAAERAGGHPLYSHTVWVDLDWIKKV